MRSLSWLSDKISSTKDTDSILPLKLSWEDRHSMHVCPQKQFFVSCWSCWQCTHWEMHSAFVNEITNRSGHCVFPRLASKESRDSTAQVFFKATGVQRDIVLQEMKSKKRVKKEKVIEEGETKRKKLKGGLSQRKEFALLLLKAENSRLKYFTAMKHKFPEISDAYINTLFYIAKKEIKDYKETDEATLSKRKGRVATGSNKKEIALSLLRKNVNLSKDEFIEQIIQTDQSISSGYGAVLFYQAKTALGIKSAKKGKSKVSR